MFNNSKNHLKEAGESYIKHLKFACIVSSKMFIASIQCFIHALIPGIFKTSGSRAIRDLYNQINKRT